MNTIHRYAGVKCGRESQFSFLLSFNKFYKILIIIFFSRQGSFLEMLSQWQISFNFHSGPWIIYRSTVLIFVNEEAFFTWKLGLTVGGENCRQSPRGALARTMTAIGNRKINEYETGAIQIADYVPGGRRDRIDTWPFGNSILSAGSALASGKINHKSCDLIYKKK